LGIVLGDAIGEQASQTLRNIRAIDSAVRGLPVLRPLLCYEKPETMALARRIGTYEISARPDAGCRAVPKRPTTAADLGTVLRAEEALDVDGLVEEALSGLKVVRLSWPKKAS